MSIQFHVQPIFAKASRILFWAACVFILSTASAAAADAKIGFIDLQKAISETKDWKRGIRIFQIELPERKGCDLQEREIDQKDARGSQ